VPPTGGGTVVPPTGGGTVVTPIKPVPPRKQGAGFLSVNSRGPWAEVRERGKLLGQTPFLRVKLAAGEHTLVCTNPERQLTRTIKVTIEPGQELVKTINLADPEP
jgi:hypothetical protein